MGAGESIQAMNKVCLIIVFSFIAAPFCFGTEQGEAVFRSNRCSACHKAERSISNPSLKEIAQAYQGQRDRLQKYLQGKLR